VLNLFALLNQRRIDVITKHIYWLMLVIFNSVVAQDLTILNDPPVAPNSLIGLPSSPIRAMAIQGFEVNAQSREEVRNFYNTIFQASENVPAQWTGNTNSCNAGTISQTYQDATLLRVNYFRAMAGVPANITFDETNNAKAQKAALIMLANNSLSHTPPTSWKCYSDEGSEAAGKSNLSLGNSGANAVFGQMQDEGDNNYYVGHRRWILYPQTQIMGAGSVQTESWQGANALWVFDDNIWKTRPNVRDEFVSWPPKGYVPNSLVFGRWSFSYPNADFTNASISMQRQGKSISLTKEIPKNGAGENTLVWIPNLSSFSSISDDVTYTVNIQDVLIQGISRNFNYTVTAIDPSKYGTDTVLPTISGIDQPVLNKINAYSLTTVPKSTGYEWQSAQLKDFTQTEGAENGLNNFTTNTLGDYEVIISDIKATGNKSFHLTHTQPQDQILTFKPKLFVNSGAQLQFASRLGLASTAQFAKVQISTDDGQSWKSIFEQAGNDSSGETSFSTKTLNLNEFANKTVQIRFMYYYEMGGMYYYQSSNAVGWYIDDIRFTNVSEITNSVKTSISSPSFSFTPTQNNTRYVLQARAVVYNKYPLEWGQGKIVTVGSNDTIPTTPISPVTPTPVTPTPTTGFQITPDIWINASINSVEKGLINAVWKQGGSDNTSRGDKVIWGHFYANPNDVSWGSEQNPDLFVKVWFDVSGRIDVNYFHVSVPDIQVQSNKKNGTKLSSTATLTDRYVRHYFNADDTQNSAVEKTKEILNINSYLSQSKKYSYHTAIPSTYILTMEKGTIAGQLFDGGSALTKRGDFVYWGYFYADSKQVSWGSLNNPEVFFKIWRDAATGRYDVNFFHVSVPDIEVDSKLAFGTSSTSLLVDNTTLSSSKVTLQQRYTRHEYHLN